MIFSFFFEGTSRWGVICASNGVADGLTHVLFFPTVLLFVALCLSIWGRVRNERNDLILELTYFFYYSWWPVICFSRKCFQSFVNRPRQYQCNNTRIDPLGRSRPSSLQDYIIVSINQKRRFLEGEKERLGWLVEVGIQSIKR